MSGAVARDETQKSCIVIDGRQAEDGFTQKLAEAVESVKANEKWGIVYMTLQEHYDEKYNEGHEEGLKQGRLQEIFMSVQEGDYSIERGAQKAGMSMEQFQTAMAETKL